ncbi:hypothetical protein FRC04_005045 [Tulasnella sp. 424]|nr:hypothetical protein FRC04_005045 [Tulasnella sp. 424]
MSGSSWRGRYYRIRDIRRIGAEWTSIKDKSDHEIVEFKERKISELKEIVDTSSRCMTWERSQIVTKREEEHNLKEARKTELFARLEALGHDQSDVRSWAVFNSAFFKSTAQLTESRWNTMRPQLETLVNEAKNQRLERQRQQTIQSRESIAEDLIDEYYTSANIRPAFTPPFGFRDIIASAVFQDVIQRPNDVSIDFQEALDALPELVAEVSQAIQLDLLQRMVDGGAPDLCISPTVSNFDPLLLATATFFCNGCYLGLPLCGADELDSHRCLPIPNKPRFYCLSYNHRASTAVVTLFEAAGLDPSTTAGQMDQRDLRFYCSGCSPRLAMSWRDAVAHARTMAHDGPGGWELFSPEDIATIKDIEKNNTDDVRYRFRCNRCLLPSGGFRRSELEDHLRKRHSINGLADPTSEFRTTMPPEPVVFSPTNADSRGMSS